MPSEGRFGFRFHLPPGSNRWWLLMWLVCTAGWIAIAIALPVSVTNFLIWVASFLLLFLVPELIAIHNPTDSLPPLTHVIRHFFDDWLAFPLIYGTLGIIAAKWLGLEAWRYLGVGAAFAALGWLTTHFTVTFARPDPFPKAMPEPHVVAPGPEAAAIAPPKIRDPHPR